MDVWSLGRAMEEDIFYIYILNGGKKINLRSLAKGLRRAYVWLCPFSAVKSCHHRVCFNDMNQH